MRPISLIVVVLAVVSGGALASTASAVTLSVAANGVDSATCGAAATPCRTIGRAVLNAVDNDRILVGPGVYGNINRDGDLADSGEESPPGGCLCLVRVNKRLTLESSAGAAMTIIDGTNGPFRVLSLEANGIVFGARDRGFTIRGGAFGLNIPTGTVGVRVIGNVFTGNTTGLFAEFGSSAHVISDNVFSDNLFGADTHGTASAITGNAFVRNSDGLRASGDATASGNAFIGNSVGVRIQDSNGVSLTRNAILGNYVCGIILEEDTGPTVVSQNNIYGNGVSNANCGLRVEDGPTAQAPRNFWGAAGGPGADPADATEGSVTVDPVATTRFAVTVDAGR